MLSLPKTQKRSGFTPIVSKRRSGFTLIELLVVITIIAILAAIALISFNTAQSRGRDARRKSDLANFQRALELYRNDEGCYMDSGGGGAANCAVAVRVGGLLTVTASIVGPTCGPLQNPPPGPGPGFRNPVDTNIIYINVTPCDPQDVAPFFYYYLSPDTLRVPAVAAGSSNNYRLIACLENSRDPDREQNLDPDGDTNPGVCDGGAGRPGNNPNGLDTSISFIEP